MKKVILVILALAFVAGIPMKSAFADEATREELNQIKAALEENFMEDKNALLCMEKLIPLYDTEVLKFLDFMEENFQNKSANSSLINITIARYRDFKNTLKGYLIEIEPRASTEAEISKYSETLAAYAKCTEVTNIYTDIAKAKMIQYIRQTHFQKKTTAFTEKYKGINDKLRDLHLQIADLYGFFETFKNKLPGFLSQCVRN